MKRAALIIRRGSSLKDSSGASGVASREAARSATPPKGSMRRRSGRESAIALTVKSRRDRSTSTASENTTWGLRLSDVYASARCVVISMVRPSTFSPIVPNFLPWVHTASAMLFAMLSICSGRASVVKSRSDWSSSRPSTASRTTPPTR